MLGSSSEVPSVGYRKDPPEDRRTGFRLMEPLNTNLTINHQSSLRETRLMRCSRAEFIISFLELPCHCNITNSSLLDLSMPREALLY